LLTLRRQLPNLDDAIVAAAGQQLSVRAEDDRIDRANMTRVAGHTLVFEGLAVRGLGGHPFIEQHPTSENDLRNYEGD
jgi:hypothetical protein